MLAAIALLAAVQQLVIRHATVFDTRTLAVRPRTTIVIRDGRIDTVLPDSAARTIRATHTIDARGRLVTPGLIDVHHHVGYVFPDSITSGAGTVSRFVLRPDSITAYRKRWASAYLPFGVTTVREVGGQDRDLPLHLAWMRRSASAPDYFSSGGAFVSHEEGRVPYLSHTVVHDTAEAARRVREYHAAGIRDIKLYWRLREPEYIAAYKEARRLGMHVTTHVDWRIMSVERALNLGVRHFEHAFTLAVDVMRAGWFDTAWLNMRKELGNDPAGGFYWGALEYFNLVGEGDAKLTRLILLLARSGATVTPTLHLFAQHVGAAAFRSSLHRRIDSTEVWTPAQRARAREGFRILGTYVRQLHAAGVQLAVGTDWLDPGLATLSEMIVLHKIGIPMPDVIQIATLGGARVLERDSEFGVIEPGYRANLVIFDVNPLMRPDGLFGPKLIVKDGVRWSG